jgi:hypothetical protein
MLIIPIQDHISIVAVVDHLIARNHIARRPGRVEHSGNVKVLEPPLYSRRPTGANELEEPVHLVVTQASAVEDFQALQPVVRVQVRVENLVFPRCSGTSCIRKQRLETGFSLDRFKIMVYETTNELAVVQPEDSTCTAPTTKRT